MCIRDRCQHTFPPARTFATLKEYEDWKKVQQQERKRTLKQPAEADKGKLQPIASSILMAFLYASRYARFDLLRAINHLACYITRWTSICDKRLHPLVCYISSSLHLRMMGWVGDPISDIEPHLFADADLAGCTFTQRSTNGLHLLLRPQHHIPNSRRQQKTRIWIPQHSRV